MNFSEYVAILSGNTDLLDKAKLEKQITALESERQAFNRSKWTAQYRLDDIQQSIEGHKNMVSRMQNDWEKFTSTVLKDDNGTFLNPVLLHGVNGSNPKEIGSKLNEIGGQAQTRGEYHKIGTLYGFNILL